MDIKRFLVGREVPLKVANKVINMLYRIAVLLLMTITTYAQKKSEEGVIIVRGSTYEGIIFPKPKEFVKLLGPSIKPTEFFTPSLKEIKKMEQQVMLRIPQLYKQFMQKEKSNNSIFDDPDCPIEESLKKFKRQYCGLVFKGEKSIHVNFLDPKYHNVKKLVLGLPTLGGCTKIVASYSVAKNKFTYFDMDFSGE